MNGSASPRVADRLRHLGLAFLGATGATLAALLVYHHLVVRPALAVGVVDVSEVYRAKEAEFTLMLTRANSEEDREQALTMARAFAQRLPVALEELPRDCGCIVLVKSAVAGAPQARDLTPLLRRKVTLP